MKNKERNKRAIGIFGAFLLLLLGETLHQLSPHFRKLWTDYVGVELVPILMVCGLVFVGIQTIKWWFYLRRKRKEGIM